MVHAFTHATYMLDIGAGIDLLILRAANAQQYA